MRLIFSISVVRFRFSSLAASFLLPLAFSQTLQNQLSFHVDNDVGEVDSFFRNLNQRKSRDASPILNFRRKIRRHDRRPIARQRHHPFDDIFQLTHVARPFIRHQGFHDLRRHRLHFQLVRFAELRDESLNQQRNVFATFAQWRQEDAE